MMSVQPSRMVPLRFRGLHVMRSAQNFEGVLCTCILRSVHMNILTPVFVIDLMLPVVKPHFKTSV